MSRINAVPKALQDLLGNTASGVNPSELAAFVQPGLEMLPFWMLDRQEYIPSAGSVAAVFGNTFLTVPAGEIWIPIGLSFEITGTVIGEAFQIVVGVTDSSALTRVHAAVSDYIPQLTAIETCAVGYQWNRIAPLRSGDQVYGQVQRFLAAGARTTGLDFKFVRLRV